MNQQLKGIGCILASALGFAVMATCVRLVDDFGSPLSCFQKSFFRNLVAFAIALYVFLRQREPQSHTRKFSALAPRDVGMLALRCVAGTIGIFTNFYALSHITIAEGQTLNKTAPFFTVLLTWIFLKEKVRLRQFAALLIAFGGVVMIAKPGFATSDAFALTMGVIGGAMAGIAYTAVRELGIRQINATLIVLTFSAFSCLASLPFMGFYFTPMTWAQFWVLIGAGAGGALGQFGVTKAYRFAAPREIAVYDYSNIIFTSLFGWLIFDQVPDRWSSVGIFTIIAAAMIMFLSKGSAGSHCRGT